MTTFNWSALTDGQEIEFDPASDVLHFDDPLVSAGDLFFEGTDVPESSSFFYFLKTVTLNVDPLKLTTTNVTFANGSLFMVGDNTTGTTADKNDNTMTGGAGDDFFLGAEGDDDISGAGQTKAAHELCTGIPKARQFHYDVAGAGHYGIFSGRRWREKVYPELRAFIQRFNQPGEILNEPAATTRKAPARQAGTATKRSRKSA